MKTQTYSVAIEQHTHLIVEFESEQDFTDWEDLGACISDLRPLQIASQKIHYDWNPV